MFLVRRRVEPEFTSRVAMSFLADAIKATARTWAYCAILIWGLLSSAFIL